MSQVKTQRIEKDGFAVTIKPCGCAVAQVVGGDVRRRLFCGQHSIRLDRLADLARGDRKALEELRLGYVWAVFLRVARNYGATDHTAAVRGVTLEGTLQIERGADAASVAALRDLFEVAR